MIEKVGQLNLSSGNQTKPKKLSKKGIPKDATNKVTLFVNGEKVVAEGFDIQLSLNEFLRSRPGWTGTKRSCAEGGCGACTVEVQLNENGQEKTVSLNSCLRPLASCNNMSITTIEGIGSTRTKLSPISQKMVDESASQCGFCTPGFVMNMHSLLASNPKPTAQEIEDHFDGNLCRCTGYRPILAAMKSFATDAPEGSCCSKSCDMEDMCCKNKKTNGASARPLYVLSDTGAGWFAPQTMNDLFALLKANPSKTKKFVVGNTSVGVYKDQAPDMWIYIRDIPDFQVYTVAAKGIVIGGSVTITTFIEVLESVYNSDPNAVKNAYLPILLRHMKKVANSQVRNAGSVAGNLMMEHDYNFISDIWTILMAIGTSIRVIDSDGNLYDSPLDGFQNVNMTNRLIYQITLPWATQQGGFRTYKAMLRHVNSHAIVNAAFNVQFDSQYKVTSQPMLVYGGVQLYACRANAVEQLLVGRSLTDPSTLSAALTSLQQTLVPTVTPAGGNVAYRSSLILTFFYKYYLSLLPASMLPTNLKSAAIDFIRPLSSGTQTYDSDPTEYPVSAPVAKLEAPLQTTGEALYTDDIPTPSNTLHGAFVLSSQPLAKLVSIDASAALQAEGVVSFVSAKDIPSDRNSISVEPVPWSWHEPVFADDKVIYNGQPVGLILADSKLHAEAAAKLVKVTYDTTGLDSPVLNLQDAIARQSFFPELPNLTPAGPFTTGDLNTGFSQSKHIIQDSVAVETQYHFHMETQTCIVIPEEGQRMKIHASTQWPAIVQALVGRILGINGSNVTVEVERIGGAYGGKITRANMVATACAVAANKVNRPVRIAMDLNSNMEMVGKRHPFQCDFKVGFDDNGKVIALQMTIYADGGCSYDSTTVITDMALTTADNCYFVPNYYCKGVECHTNLPSNTPMRGPGCVEAIYFLESIMERVASYLQMSPDDVKLANFYTKNQVTPYGQPLTYWNLPSVWDQLLASSDYKSRAAAVAAYNTSNRWTKKGIALVPMKYGIGWSGAKYGCEVAIYMDGSVSITHAGVEVGQGINTKVAQVAALELNIPLSLISVYATSTKATANTDPTGGSITSGLNAKAVIAACQELNKRLAPFRAMMRHYGDAGASSWPQVVLKAYGAGVDLKASAWQYENDKNPFTYNSYGVACAEVFIDVLTGETQILRADILFDCGVSLNPAVDIGQVEGAFVQGIGYFLTEHIEIDQTTGRNLTNGTWEYKPPSQKDIPIVFNVGLLKDAPNPVGVLRSKASGEPPYALACSVFFAVKHAVMAARKDAGLAQEVELKQPATVYRIQQACGVVASQLHW